MPVPPGFDFDAFLTRIKGEAEDFVATAKEVQEATTQVDTLQATKDQVALEGQGKIDTLKANQEAAMTALQIEVDTANSTADSNLTTAINARDASLNKQQLENDFFLDLITTYGSTTKPDPT